MGSSQNAICHVTLVVWNTLQTSINQFCLWREYIQPPTFDPNNSLLLEDLFNLHNPTANSNHHTSLSLFGNIFSLSSEPELPPNNTSDQPADEALNRPSYWPFSSKTVQLFMRWLYNGNTIKSDSDANSLVQNCILSPDFQVDKLKGFNVCSENKPTGIHGEPQKLFMVPGLYHPSIVSVIHEMFTGQHAHLLHFTPFKLFHQFTPREKPDKNSSEHIYGEVYTSDAFIEAYKTYKDVQLHGEMPPSNLSCDCEKVVAALMFSSDSTHLANFGNAKAWPIYMMLGNLSKYLRSVVSSEAIQHLAYIPSNAFVERLGGGFNPSKMLTVNLLHEIELGTWKTLFTHLIRLLYSAGNDLVSKLDEQYRTIGTFGIGGSGIHRFSSNSSEMKKMAARDFEDLLQGEQCHRIVKRLYGLTNKKNAMSQIGTKYTRHQALLRTLEKQETNEIEKPEHIDKHFVISNSKAETLSLFSFVHENLSDPAKQDFIAKLKDHILGRIMDRTFNGDMHEDFSDDDHNTIQFRDGKIFRHRTMRVNYTTYDIRRDYDILNPRSHPFCMVASPNMETDPEAHPFWYAQVIGIFHAEVQHCGPRSCNFAWKPMEFLWVRWLGVEPDHVFGRHVAKLPKIGFVPTEVKEDYAFSFLDPSLVIRGCHLLPVFVGGRTTALLPYEGPTEARKDGEMDDWVNYYVNIFVDRDMFIRHLGLGVGHSPGTAATPNLTNDSGMDWSAEDEEVDKQATGPETARVAEGNGEEDAEADEVNSDSDDENASNHGDSDDDRDYSSL
ncbi:hypothetical protein AN958_07831 [Leucoagaricus sp. SymC.cos]|nr:hypothetical protein AN958_07831 [Leucoagaricus sp. SymC.cos]